MAVEICFLILFFGEFSLFPSFFGYVLENLNEGPFLYMGPGLQAFFPPDAFLVGRAFTNGLMSTGVSSVEAAGLNRAVIGLGD